ncbi:MAG: hypothetical protein HQL50_11585 [Magnetococcales bacterium]|nr:hypothetical protein [Magnetococcales bacterium]
MNSAVNTRYQAFGIHLLLSIAVVSLLFILVFYVWYPTPFMASEGTIDVVYLLIAVDVVLGPVLTLVVFNKKKKSLAWDLAVIAVIQLTAFSYGAQVLFTERPLFLAFAGDRFVVVAASSIDLDQLSHPELQSRPLIGPETVFVRIPQDRALRSQVLTEVMQGGKDYEKRPEYFEPITPMLKKIAASGTAADRALQRDPQLGEVLAPILNVAENTMPGDIRLLAMKGGHRDMTVAMHQQDGTLLGIIDRVPWPLINGR